jgi:hypothetical protein
MVPPWSARKRVPSSTGPASLVDATVGTAVAAKIEHGHEPAGGGAAAVRNVQVAGAIVLPLGSRAPDTLTV